MRSLLARFIQASVLLAIPVPLAAQEARDAAALPGARVRITTTGRFEVGDVVVAAESIRGRILGSDADTITVAIEGRSEPMTLPKAGRTLEGTVVAKDDEALTLEVDGRGGLVSVPRDAVATLVVLAPPAELVADDTLREILLLDGTTLIGRVASVEEGWIVVETPGGVRLELARAKLRSAQPVRGRMVGRELWREDPHGTRLLFGPTARTLRGGEGYFGAFELVLPFVAYGVTDRVTVAGGTPILPGSMGEVFYLAPKVQLLSTSWAQVATGVLAFLGDDDAFGIAYGVATLGTPDHALTVGAGWGFEGDDVEDEPVLMVGGETRVGPRIKLIAESYFLPGEGGGLASLGVRFFGERLSADFGIGFGLGEDAECCLPLVNFVYAFGGR